MQEYWSCRVALTNKTIMVVRTEYLNEDWIAVNVQLGHQTDTLQVAVKDSSKVEQPVKNISSEENRTSICLALKKE